MSHLLACTYLHFNINILFQYTIQKANLDCAKGLTGNKSLQKVLWE